MYGGQEIKCLIAVNAGSSSLKATIYNVSELQNPSEIERISINIASRESADYNAFIEHVKTKIEGCDVIAIGHRVVHGGPKYTQTVHISEQVKDDLQTLASFDPDHTPFALRLIDLCAKAFPGVKQFACFDTAFFHNMPRLSQILPIPFKYQEEGLRRYGFHGLSYSYLQQAFRDYAGEAAVNGRVIYAHLGSGASLAATDKGQPVDTTMSFTPASGLVMSSRAGDLDPGISWYLYRQYGISPEQFNQLVNTESGLLGVSGLSSDMKVLLDNESSNHQAAEAVDLFCYRVAGAIGSLTTAIGGLDSLIFSGGIGEQSAILRQRICNRLDFLSVSLDDSRNRDHQRLISADNSKVGVHVLPTDEAYSVTIQVIEKLTKHGGDNEQ